MVAALRLIALLQATPELHVSVDQDRIAVGEEVLFTMQAVSRSTEPMDLTIAPLNGFEVVSRSERTEVSFSAGATRTTVLEIRLRALRPGRWQIGPARATQGQKVAEADPIIVDVEPSAAAGAPALNPRLNALLQRAPPPPRGKAAVALIVSAESVTVGEQVDVVTAAWFPRDLRVQLRRPPTLQPPVINGVWSYPQSAPAGIAATRNIGGSAYDLFVAHQVVFPLVPGPTPIPGAMLKYSTPLALQFFSQEERFALSSQPETLAVRPLPRVGRPAGFSGAVAAHLRLTRSITPPAARIGEGISVELALTGEGNTALWPPPEVKWPRNLRAYVDRVEEQVTTVAGRVGGIKTFRYLVVADSAGPLTLPAVRYTYYDLAARGYHSTEVPAAALPVSPSGDAGVSAALPPPLLEATSASIIGQLAPRVSGWGWLAIFVAPPILALLGRWPRRRTRTPTMTSGTGLRAAEEKLDALVRGLVPDPDQRSRAGLAAAVRAAGADVETAARVAVVRERLLARRYGPPELSAEDHDLIAQVEELIRTLGGSLRGWRGRVAPALLILPLLTGPAVSQAPAPEALYETGALRAAAEGFTRRAELEPAVAAHWYNLGAAYYRLGARGRATAAWVQARRLDPREPTINRALRLTPAPDTRSARLLWSPPVKSEELLLLGALLWIAGWLGWRLRPQWRDRWSVLLVFAAVSAVAGIGLQAWHRRPVAVVLDQTTMRLSPHGRAPAVGPLEAGGAVRMLREDRGWMLVRAGSAEGWVAAEAIAAISG